MSNITHKKSDAVQSLIPRVLLRRRGDVITYEVMESELESLNKSFGDESQALSFFMLLLGALLSSLPGWASTPRSNVLAWTVYCVGSITLAVATLWFGLKWSSERKIRVTVLGKIYENAQMASEMPPVVVGIAKGSVITSLATSDHGVAGSDGGAKTENLE